MTTSPPRVHDWDDPTDAELAADIWHREHSRGRHGIREWPRTEVFRALATERAQAVLDALARRRSRRVETAEELDTLPEDTIVADSDGNAWQMGECISGVPTWSEAGSGDHWTSGNVSLPATVLWTPRGEQ